MAASKPDPRPAPKGSLRDLGGTGEDIVIPEHPAKNAAIRLLNGPPEYAAEALLAGRGDPAAGLELLVGQNLLRPKQYELILAVVEAHIAERRQEVRNALETALGRTMLQRVSDAIHMKIHNLLHEGGKRFDKYG